MIVSEWDEFISRDSHAVPAAVTIGVFDGVHLGHQELITSICRYSAEHRVRSMVFTFRASPKRHTRHAQHRNVQSLRQRLECLQELGVQETVLIDFTRKFSRMKGEDFWNIVSRCITIRHLALGDDFRMGKNGSLNSAGIKRFFAGQSPSPEIIVFTPVLVDGVRVSSSRLRDAVAAGDLAQYARLTGRPYWVETAALLHHRDNADIILPPSGRYMVPAAVADGELHTMNLSVCLGSSDATSSSIESFYALQLRQITQDSE
ncbi:FAD synthetase family protein [Spirochaeta africana]|uniref:FAD synthase n=1 Tax=Spirochaeta africana (strain ATCC 700263 / DSM 8902 / Z-7692) TaxID=889378 RepID=H9UJA3_SPIAZ|nr:FAD synthetase family protein [Spirochaeta africana]AFG37596.1 FAD synthase [Spirochaeta africana DSM 8902]